MYGFHYFIILTLCWTQDSSFASAVSTYGLSEDLVTAIYDIGQCFFQGEGVRKDVKMSLVCAQNPNGSSKASDLLYSSTTPSLLEQAQHRFQVMRRPTHRRNLQPEEGREIFRLCPCYWRRLLSRDHFPQFSTKSIC